MLSSSESDKARLRREMAARRASADAVWRAEASERIAVNALSLPGIGAAEVVALYAAKPPEADTQRLILDLVQRKGSVLLPRVSGAGGLLFHRVTNFPEGMVRGGFGILEPDPGVYKHIVAVDKIDLMFLPGLVFDLRGARIGYGKGHYDRLLSSPNRARLYGLCFDFQVLDRVPSDPHDVLLHGLVTESRVLAELPPRN